MRGRETQRGENWRTLLTLVPLAAVFAACAPAVQESDESQFGDSATERVGDKTENVAIDPTTPVPPDTLAFSVDANGSAFLADGWSQPEAGFTWSTDSASQIVIPAGSLAETLAMQAGEGNWQLNLRMWAFLTENHDTQKVRVFANDVQVGSFDFDADAGGGSEQTYSVDLGETWTPEDSLTLTFEIDDPRAPSSVMDSTDDRTLGIALASISFDKEPAS